MKILITSINITYKAMMKKSLLPSMRKNNPDMITLISGVAAKTMTPIQRKLEIVKKPSSINDAESNTPVLSTHERVVSMLTMI